MNFKNEVKSLLPNSVLENQNNLIDNYLIMLENEVQTLDPMQALEALSSLVQFKPICGSETNWESTVIYILNLIQNSLYQSKYHLFSCFSGVTQVGYYIFELSYKIPSLTRFLNGINSLLVNNINKYLYFCKDKVYTNKSYELISGLSGPLRYLLNFNDDASQDLSSKLIQLFIKNSQEKIILGNKVPGWHYYPHEFEKKYIDFNTDNGLLDYGVAHGIGGPLIVLSLAYQKGFKSEDLLAAINSIISEYLKMYYYINNIIYFPTKISFEQYIKKDEFIHTAKQMSWCYGSVGILRAMYIAAISTKNKDIEQFVLNEFIKIAQMDVSNYRLNSPMVCHGYVGVATIMMEMYNDTGNSIFFNRTIELLILIDKMLSLDSDQKNDENDGLPNYNYLEGLSGVLETMYAIINDETNINHQRLLIK